MQGYLVLTLTGSTKDLWAREIASLLLKSTASSAGTLIELLKTNSK